MCVCLCVCVPSYNCCCFFKWQQEQQQQHSPGRESARQAEQLKSGLNAFSVSLSVCFGFFLQANPALQMPQRCADEAACPCLLCCCFFCCSLICLLWLRLDRSQFDFSPYGAALFRLQHEFICFEIVTRHLQEPQREQGGRGSRSEVSSLAVGSA